MLGLNNGPGTDTISPYIFTPDIFNYVESAIKNTPNGAELYWNDIANLMLADGKRFTAVELKNAEYCDSGTPLTYLKTMIKIALRHPEVGESFRSYLAGLKL
jgi:UTP--glucose-1-phosphate uridylyltransferase